MSTLTNSFTRARLSLLMAMLCLAGFSHAEENYTVAGSAYNLENNKLIYRELYTAINDVGEVKVDYAKPDGSVFASKTLVYQSELFQPSFVLEDKRDDEVVSAEFKGPRLVLAHKQGNSRNEQTIMDNARIVIDAGFDAYIQTNWDKLVADKRLLFQFAMPTRLSIVELEVRKIKSSESPVYNSEYGSGWIYFRIAPAKKLASFFAEPIYLAYDPNGKYLMRYHGRSNLDDDKGEPWDVRIEYEYSH